MCSLKMSNVTSSMTSSLSRVMPYMSVASKKVNRAISWIGENVSSPQNRLILGVTALMSQPFIDLHNTKVDEDTRKFSAARTVAKIIAGTSTGFLVRYGCIKAIDYCSLLPSQITKSMKHPRLRMLFTPDSTVTKALKDLNQYKKALGTIISLAVMVVTNFLIDAPLTKFLTNRFVDKYDLDKKSKSKSANTPPEKQKSNHKTDNYPTQQLDPYLFKSSNIFSTPKDKNDVKEVANA